MSANNWTTCPMCKKKSIDLLEKEDKKLRNAYGKVSVEEYKDMLSKSRLPASSADDDFFISSVSTSSSISTSLLAATCGNSRPAFRWTRSKSSSPEGGAGAAVWPDSLIESGGSGGKGWEKEFKCVGEARSIAMTSY